MTDMGLPELLWPTSLPCYDLTLPTAAENLALDEALLAAVDADPNVGCLRFWQPTEHFVVLGRSNRVETEVNLEACVTHGISIFRRASGGGTVLVGPGCLCYSLALPMTDIVRALGVSKVTDELMARSAEGLKSVLTDVSVCGTSDLTRNGVKFSGNAQRRLQRSFLHHGTLLFDFDLSLIERYLTYPSREPGYRMSRRHGEFVTNVNLTAEELKRSFRLAWNANLAECPFAIQAEANKIAASRYCSQEWQISPVP